MANYNVKRYTLDDIEKIICNGISYTIDENIMHIIQQISKQVGSPEYVKTPQFEKKNKNCINDNFKPTQTQIRKGLDVSIDNIRKILNKISDKTYDALFPSLMDELDKLDEYNTKEEFTKVSETIFSIVSENIFYSELYASIYSILYKKYKFMSHILKVNINEYKDYINQIKYFCPEEDYDNFCKNNKENIIRKSIGVFFVNLAKQNIICIDVICEIIVYIQEMIHTNIKKKGMREIVDELSEIEHAMIISGKDILEVSHQWSILFEHVRDSANSKTKDFESLTNKTIFKHMDILDCIG
jgi:hypothetical protein